MSSRNVACVASICLVAISSLSCALFEDEETLDVTYREEIPLSFTIDADKLCPSGRDCSQMEGAAPEDIPLDPFEKDFDIDIVERTGNEELADYAGRFKSIEITEIDYKLPSNTLNFDLPPVTVYVGPKPAETHDEAAVVELTTIPVIEGDGFADSTAPVKKANRDASSELFKTLRISAIPYAQKTIKKGEPFPPKGKAEVELVIHVKFVANPADQVER